MEEINLERRLNVNIAMLKNCEERLAEEFTDGMYRMKVFAMAAISELNRKIYSK